MLKAVTRQATKVDAKIKHLNDEAAALAAQDSEDGHKKKRPNAITTANFFDHHATPEDIAVSVTEEDFLNAHRELIPSVSAGELAHYERVRASFEGGRGESGSGAPAGGRPSLAPLTLGSGGRSVSAASSGPLRSAKRKDKGKGKAIATAGGSEEEDGDGEYEDDYGVAAEDGEVNGGRRDKGKGKAVAEFQDGTGDGDEGLYDD